MIVNLIVPARSSATLGVFETGTDQRRIRAKNTSQSRRGYGLAMAAVAQLAMRRRLVASRTRFYRTCSAGPEPRPHVTAADPDTSWMTILAALAHEFGHVQWAVSTIRNPGDMGSNFTNLHQCASGDFFEFWDYSNEAQLQPPGRWRGFSNRDTGNGVPIDHFYLPTSSEFNDSRINFR